MTPFFMATKPRRPTYRRHSTSRVRAGVVILAFACEGSPVDARVGASLTETTSVVEDGRI
jgi:hypothetical protein